MTTRPKPTHAYICTSGHQQEAPFALACCQARPLGHVCTGSLRRIGKGSRSK